MNGSPPAVEETVEPENTRLASVSMDLDNLWSYMKIRGDKSWVDRPSYLDVVTPFMLDFLEKVGIKITFFIVGADAADSRNGPALRSLTTAGHEVGNHSFEHEPWLHLYSPEKLQNEIRLAGAAIAEATGVTPRGFRGPGFSWSPTLLEILEDDGYQYDASTLPSYLGPLARRYYFWTAKDLTDEEREQRKELFGRFSDGLRPVRPYYWRLPGGKQLLEIPVTTIPVLKTPFHFSYLAYLSRISERLMFAYLDVALAACRATRTEPSFLLHPLDVVGADIAPQLAFFPGMDIPSERKAQLLARVLKRIAGHFALVPMGPHAAAHVRRGQLTIREVG